MNYLDYKKYNVNGKLMEIVSLQLKLKNILLGSSFEKQNLDSINYLIFELKQKIKKLKNELKRIR